MLTTTASPWTAICGIPACSVCGGPTIDGSGCEFCPVLRRGDGLPLDDDDLALVSRALREDGVEAARVAADALGVR